MNFFYVCTNPLGIGGIDKALLGWATRIHDLSAITAISEPSFIYYILQDEDNFLQIRRALQDNVFIQYALIYDENYFQVSYSKIKQVEHVNLLDKAFFSITTNYKSKRILEVFSSKSVHEIPTAIDTHQLLNTNDTHLNELLVVLDSGEHSSEIEFLCNYYGINFNTIHVSTNIDPREEKMLVEYFPKYKFIISLTTKNHTWVLYAAALGCIVIGDTRNDYLRYCYAYTIIKHENIRHYFDIIMKLRNDNDREQFISTLAKYKAASFNPANIGHAVEMLQRDKSISSCQEFLSCHINLYPAFVKEIKLTFGTAAITINKNEFVVFCAVKNGEAYIQEWMKHYIKLGASHFFIVDNGSTDETILLFKRYKNVTILETTLDFKYYESEIRKFVVKNYCPNMWCLSVDIDEFFDFPMSDMITMKNFLDYQNNGSYTAVISHMLDMFCAQETGEPFREKHIYYDNTNLFKNNYANLGSTYNKYNSLGNEHLQFFYGGVRTAFFDGNPNEILLMKHSLTFQNGTLEPHTDPHYCDKAHVSDISCVLFHYKFTDFSIPIVMDRAKKNIYNYFADIAYQAYLKKFEKKGGIELHSEHAKRYTNISSLLQEQFISVSPAYIKMVRAIKD